MSRRGFTLLEVLVASALAAMLMVAVLGVLGQITTPMAKQGWALPADSPNAGDALTRLIRSDLSQADRIDASTPNQITLEGWLSLSPVGLERSHREVGVRYRIERLDGRPTLWRDEFSLGDEGQTLNSSLVAMRVEKIELALIEDTNDSAGVTHAGGANRQGGFVEASADDVTVQEDQPQATLWRLRVWWGHEENAGDRPAASNDASADDNPAVLDRLLVLEGWWEDA